MVGLDFSGWWGLNVCCQDWEDEGYAWVDSRVATAKAHIVKNIKAVILKDYFGASGRFDIETFKIDFTRFISDKKNDSDLSARMAGASLG